MVAYPKRVSCDQQTFLHSKLKSNNFKLLEPKPLKGFQYVGPIYEFFEPIDNLYSYQNIIEILDSIKFHF